LPLLANRFVHLRWHLDGDTYRCALEDGFAPPPVLNTDPERHAARPIADAQLWNLAADLEVNDYLPDGMAYPSLEGKPIALLPRQFNLPDGEIAEWYYQRLVEQVREQAQAGSQQ
jgi:hypothetical protein